MKAIVEFDASSAKLIDYLNKRPLMAETSNCPLIPVIVLVTDETKINDTKEQLMSVGGVNKIVQLNAPSKEILMAIMDVVYNRKRVEDTFRSIKKVRLISSKYPYLPVFGVKSSLPKNKETGIDAGKSGSTSLTGVDFKLDEIEDISECPSLLPEFLSPARRSTLPWLKTRDASTLPDDFDLDGPTEDRNGNFVPQSMTQFQGESFRSDIPDDIDSFGEKLDIPLPSTVLVAILFVLTLNEMFCSLLGIPTPFLQEQTLKELLMMKQKQRQLTNQSQPQVHPEELP
jgi:hypothetical protein